MITAFPKIFTLGTDYIRDIFKEEVEVTEKIDGSQFAFGKINGDLFLRSKGAQLFVDNPEGLFAEGIAYIERIQDRLPANIVFYSEYLKKPKHNTLKYGKIPKNHLALFGAMVYPAMSFLRVGLDQYAELLEVDMTPVLYKGRISNMADFDGIFETMSFLGEAKIEGVVVKNYHRQFLLGGQPMPLMAGKFVSETFKEVHRERWGAEETGKSRMEIFFDSFRTPARWDKAVQHLRECGELENIPRDIGKLYKEIHLDIEAEEKEAVKEWLWNEFKGQLKRKATAGLAEWYKEQLLGLSFAMEESE